DRAKLSILAIFAALAAGGALAAAAELAFATIRGRNHLASLVDDHPIAVIPYIKAETDRRIPAPFTKKGGGKPGAAKARASARARVKELESVDAS
ncbi:MAG: hypothetical protein AAGJ87_07390, partial [Pseudomonadota bacterium]